MHLSVCLSNVCRSIRFAERSMVGGRRPGSDRSPSKARQPMGGDRAKLAGEEREHNKKPLECNQEEAALLSQEQCKFQFCPYSPAELHQNPHPRQAPHSGQFIGFRLRRPQLGPGPGPRHRRGRGELLQAANGVVGDANARAV